MAAAGKVATRGKGKALKLQHRALQHFGHDVGAVSEDYVDFRILPDSQAEQIEWERVALRRLQGALDWQPREEDIASLPERMLQGLRATTASRLISCWVQVRCVDLIVAEIGEAINGIDLWRPVFREKMDNTLARLEAIRQHLRLLSMELELREPLPEELDEVRGWFSEVPARS